ncbi:hypothetical protein PA7_21800 [Pseudonocardia asaccharolytica DSM 44247 = NBRC 16224]|uniref:Uncharacterized protein n=1 Tax=Pseudonocardia asaccharolytica DSM 44247 = NBRC 16224 TaxID=1123024 RepID=A0A511D1D3_9PSEU|nr:hypothetical protein PA7_21800 [Pseudonocardia asaccharolytica DSM 44247 = NBRC 16224]
MDTWQEQATLIAEVLGEQERTASVVRDLEARIADVAARHPVPATPVPAEGPPPCSSRGSGAPARRPSRAGSA